MCKETEENICPVCHNNDKEHCQDCFEIEVKDHCSYDNDSRINGNEYVNHEKLTEPRQETTREHVY